MKKMLSIVIPAYNEPLNIEKTIKEIKKKIKTPHEIFVVCDYRQDTTLPVLKILQKSNKNLYPLINSVSRGPSGAIRTGIKKSSGRFLLVTMADLCDDLTQVDKMVKMMTKGIDIVCPSRYMKGGRQELDSPLKVGLPKMAGMFLHLLTNIPTVDPTNSYKLYSRSLLDKISIKSTVSFSITFEIVVKAHLLNAKIVEIPTIWKDRQHGKTNFKLTKSLLSYTPWFLLCLLKNRLFTLPLTTRFAYK